MAPNTITAPNTLESNKRAGEGAGTIQASGENDFARDYMFVIQGYTSRVSHTRPFFKIYRRYRSNHSKLCMIDKSSMHLSGSHRKKCPSSEDRTGIVNKYAGDRRNSTNVPQPLSHLTPQYSSESVPAKALQVLMMIL